MKPISQLRVPCPYDPKHTCFATKMERHLKICNSKPLAVLPDYLVPGMNSGDGRPLDEKQDKDKQKLTVSNVSDEKLINIIGQLMSTYKKYVEGQIKLEPLEHTVLEDELNNPEYGKTVRIMMMIIFLNLLRSQCPEALDPELLPARPAGQVRAAGEWKHFCGVWKWARPADLLADESCA